MNPTPESTGLSPVRLAVSACLLGRPTRYDGTAKPAAHLARVFDPVVEWVRVCPEVECGMGVPREPLRLEGDAASPRMVVIRTGVDWTDRMTCWARCRAAELVAEGLWGIVLKARSPSCGLRGLSVHRKGERPHRRGVGLFARAMVERFPLVPVEEAERLAPPNARNHFVRRMFALARYRAFLAGGWGRGRLVAFHTDEKMSLLAHSPATYREMGRLVANAKALPPRRLRARYGVLMLEALRHRATPRKHANVLQHLAGFLKKHLAPDEKAALLKAIEGHRCGDVPLDVPRDLLVHHARAHGQAYLLRQTYLNPDRRMRRLLAVPDG